MDLAKQWRQGRISFEETRYRFVLTELELAMTFAHVARSSRESETISRNMRHAKQAYKAATKLIQEAPFSRQKQKAVRRSVRRVRDLFKTFPSLGREFFE